MKYVIPVTDLFWNMWAYAMSFLQCKSIKENYELCEVERIGSEILTPGYFTKKGCYNNCNQAWDRLAIEGGAVVVPWATGLERILFYYHVWFLIFIWFINQWTSCSCCFAATDSYFKVLLQMSPNANKYMMLKKKKIHCLNDSAIQDFKTEWQSTFLELEVQLEEELPSLLDVSKLQSFQHKITHFGDGYHCSTISREGGILFILQVSPCRSYSSCVNYKHSLFIIL